MRKPNAQKKKKKKKQESGGGRGDHIAKRSVLSQSGWRDSCVSYKD